MSISTNQTNQNSEENKKPEETPLADVAESGTRERNVIRKPLSQEELDFIEKDKQFKHEEGDTFKLDDGPITVHFFEGWQKKSFQEVAKGEKGEYARTVLVLSDMQTEKQKEKKLFCSDAMWKMIKPLLMKGFRILTIEKTGSGFQTKYTVVPES
jgi:hypothetical protein